MHNSLPPFSVQTVRFVEVLLDVDFSIDAALHFDIDVRPSRKRQRIFLRQLRISQMGRFFGPLHLFRFRHAHSHLRCGASPSGTNYPFLDASSHLYKRVCFRRSFGRSVVRSVSLKSEAFGTFRLRQCCLLSCHELILFSCEHAIDG